MDDLQMAANVLNHSIQGRSWLAMHMERKAEGVAGVQRFD
jgi:hypothetical protein